MNEIYIALGLFFASLIGIMFMLSKKVILLHKNGFSEINTGIESIFEQINTEQIKNILIEKIKKYGHLTVLTTLRIYIKSSNLIKTRYMFIKESLVSMILKDDHTKENTARSSKFLKVVMEYKQKIREMKDRIYEEENIF